MIHLKNEETNLFINIILTLFLQGPILKKYAERQILKKIEAGVFKFIKLA